MAWGLLHLRAPSSSTNELPLGHLHISPLLATAYSAAAFCFFSARDGWESATWSVNAISLLWRHEKKQKTLLIGTAVAPLFPLWEFRSLLSKVERVHYQFCINDQKVCEQLVKYLPKSRARDLVHNFQSWNIIGHFSWKHRVTVCFSCKWRFLAGIYISTLLSSRIASWVIFQNVFWVARMKIAANKLACLRLPIHIVLSVSQQITSI